MYKTLLGQAYIMKITETYTVNKLSKASRKKTDASSGFGELLDVDEAQGSESPQGLTPLMGLSSIGTLNILPTLDEENFKKQQNINWGKEALESLRILRDTLVYGRVSYATLQKLEEQLENIPYESADPKLKEIIDGIKVRTAVEVEKLKTNYKQS